MKTAPDPDLDEYAAHQQDARLLSPDAQRLRYDVLLTVTGFLGKPLRAVTEDDLLLWQDQFLAQLSENTKRKCVSVVREFYDWARDLNVVGEDPSAALDCPGPNLRSWLWDLPPMGGSAFPRHDEPVPRTRRPTVRDLGLLKPH